MRETEDLGPLPARARGSKVNGKMGGCSGFRRQFRAPCRPWGQLPLQSSLPGRHRANPACSRLSAAARPASRGPSVAGAAGSGQGHRSTAPSKEMLGGQPQELLSASGEGSFHATAGWAAGSTRETRQLAPPGAGVVGGGGGSGCDPGGGGWWAWAASAVRRDQEAGPEADTLVTDDRPVGPAGRPYPPPQSQEEAQRPPTTVGRDSQTRDMCCPDGPHPR